MPSVEPLYRRARAASLGELAGIPWLVMLSRAERELAVNDLRVAEAEPGDYICRVGRPVTYWFGVIEGLLKMSSDNAEGQTMTFTGVPSGGWFGEGTVLKAEPYRYNIQARGMIRFNPHLSEHESTARRGAAHAAEQAHGAAWTVFAARGRRLDRPRPGQRGWPARDAGAAGGRRCEDHR